MNDTLPLLFAAPGVNEIFTVLVAIVFFVIWLVNQISDAKKQQREKERASANVLPPPGDPAADAGVAPAPPSDPLRAQVDEFLRRAGRQPAGPNPPPAAAPRKPPAREEIVVLLDDSVAEPPRRPLPSKKGMPKALPAAREKRPVAAPPAMRPGGKPRARSVAEHVAEHVGAATQQMRQEVADLGERVKQADEQFDRQLAQKFDHKLGSLESRASSDEQPAQPAAPTPASEIAALMASPAGVRSAIVLNEILRRPMDRW